MNVHAHGAFFRFLEFDETIRFILLQTVEEITKPAPEQLQVTETTVEEETVTVETPVTYSHLSEAIH